MSSSHGRRHRTSRRSRIPVYIFAHSADARHTSKLESRLSRLSQQLGPTKPEFKTFVFTLDFRPYLRREMERLSHRSSSGQVFLKGLHMGSCEGLNQLEFGVFTDRFFSSLRDSATMKSEEVQSNKTDLADLNKGRLNTLQIRHPESGEMIKVVKFELRERSQTSSAADAAADEPISEGVIVIETPGSGSSPSGGDVSFSKFEEHVERVELLNVTERYGLFKFSVTHPRLFGLSPTCGCIRPLESQIVEIRWNGQLGDDDESAGFETSIPNVVFRIEEIEIRREVVDRGSVKRLFAELRGKGVVRRHKISVDFQDPVDEEEEQEKDELENESAERAPKEGRREAFSMPPPRHHGHHDSALIIHRRRRSRVEELEKRIQSTLTPTETETDTETDTQSQGGAAGGWGEDMWSQAESGQGSEAEPEVEVIEVGEEEEGGELGGGEEEGNHEEVIEVVEEGGELGEEEGTPEEDGDEEVIEVLGEEGELGGEEEVIEVVEERINETGEVEVVIVEEGGEILGEIGDEFEIVEEEVIVDDDVSGQLEEEQLIDVSDSDVPSLQDSMENDLSEDVDADADTDDPSILEESSLFHSVIESTPERLSSALDAQDASAEPVALVESETIREVERVEKQTEDVGDEDAELDSGETDADFPIIDDVDLETDKTDETDKPESELEPEPEVVETIEMADGEPVSESQQTEEDAISKRELARISLLKSMKLPSAPPKFQERMIRKAKLRRRLRHQRKNLQPKLKPKTRTLSRTEPLPIRTGGVSPPRFEIGRVWRDPNSASSDVAPQEQVKDDKYSLRVLVVMCCVMFLLGMVFST